MKARSDLDFIHYYLAGTSESTAISGSWNRGREEAQWVQHKQHSQGSGAIWRWQVISGSGSVHLQPNGIRWFKGFRDFQHKLKSLYKMGLDCEQEENLIRQALGKIQEIRNIRNERRLQVCCVKRIEEHNWCIVTSFQARNAGNKETIRRGALMKMLQISAQTLPLFVSKPGEKVPPLCGAIPAESSYVAKVFLLFSKLIFPYCSVEIYFHKLR